MRKELFVFIFLFPFVITYAQVYPDSSSVVEILDEDRPSVIKRNTGYINNVKIVIKWSSPKVKNREIWGLIVPYGEIWRAGANEATCIEFDKDVLINGKELKAGKYGFFVIPTKIKWTIIFNSVWNQWGAFEYDQKKDALRLVVRPIKAEHCETLEYIIEKNAIVLRWEKLFIRFKVQHV